MGEKGTEKVAGATQLFLPSFTPFLMHLALKDFDFSGRKKQIILANPYSNLRDRKELP